MKGDWSVSAAVTNLFDRYYFTTYIDGLPPAIIASAATGQSTGQLGAPRQVSVTVRKTF